MTVAELIKRLQEMPDQNAQAAIQASDSGLVNPGDLEPFGILDVEGYPKDHNFPFVFIKGDRL